MAVVRRLSEARGSGDGEPRLTIGDLARSVGVSTRTVRYYEEIGILPPPDRTNGGTRTYRPIWRFYLEGALILKDLGFSLDEIRILGRLAFGEKVSKRDQSSAVKLLDRKLHDLQRRTHIIEVIRNRIDEVAQPADTHAAVVAFVRNARSLEASG